MVGQAGYLKNLNPPKVLFTLLEERIHKYLLFSSLPVWYVSLATALRIDSKTVPMRRCPGLGAGEGILFSPEPCLLKSEA